MNIHDTLNTVELALLVMLPLVLFYQRSSWKVKNYFFHIIWIYLIWYLTYALFHELSHLWGAWVTGANVVDMQLIPRFWEGDIKTGYVQTIYTSKAQEFFIVILPYVKDIILVMIGCLILWQKPKSTSLTLGLMLTMFIFSPLYDIFNNYSSYLLGALNDFNALALTSSPVISNLIGITFTLFSLAITILILVLYKDYPTQLSKE